MNHRKGNGLAVFVFADHVFSTVVVSLSNYDCFCMVLMLFLFECPSYLHVERCPLYISLLTHFLGQREKIFVFVVEGQGICVRGRKGTKPIQDCFKDHRVDRLVGYLG